PAPARGPARRRGAASRLGPLPLGAAPLGDSPLRPLCHPRSPLRHAPLWAARPLGHHIIPRPALWVHSFPAVPCPAQNPDRAGGKSCTNRSRAAVAPLTLWSPSPGRRWLAAPAAAAWLPGREGTAAAVRGGLLHGVTAAPTMRNDQSPPLAVSHPARR